MPSYESRITTSKLLIELENYEVIILTSLSKCHIDCFHDISNVQTNGYIVAFNYLLNIGILQIIIIFPNGREDSRVTITLNKETTFFNLLNMFRHSHVIFSCK